MSQSLKVFLTFLKANLAYLAVELLWIREKENQQKLMQKLLLDSASIIVISGLFKESFRVVCC